MTAGTVASNSCVRNYLTLVGPGCSRADWRPRSACGAPSLNGGRARSPDRQGFPSASGTGRPPALTALVPLLRGRWATDIAFVVVKSTFSSQITTTNAISTTPELRPGGCALAPREPRRAKKSPRQLHNRPTRAAKAGHGAAANTCSLGPLDSPCALADHRRHPGAVRRRRAGRSPPGQGRVPGHGVPPRQGPLGSSTRCPARAHAVPVHDQRLPGLQPCLHLLPGGRHADALADGARSRSPTCGVGDAVDGTERGQGRPPTCPPRCSTTGRPVSPPTGSRSTTAPRSWPAATTGS